jgi:hypothetical protein
MFPHPSFVRRPERLSATAAIGSSRDTVAALSRPHTRTTV